MTSEQSLRSLIRGKLQSGILPGDDCTKVFGGVGNGEICDACSETIAKNQLVLADALHHYPKTLQFHARCFYIWDSERGTRGACLSTPTDG